MSPKSRPWSLRTLRVFCGGFFLDQSLKKRYILLFVFLTAEGPNQFYPRAFHCDAKLEWVCQIPRGKPRTNMEGFTVRVFRFGLGSWEKRLYCYYVFQVKPQRNPNGIIQVEYSLFSPSTDVSASRVLWCFLRTADGHHDTSVFMDGQEFWFVNQPRLSYEEASIYCSSNKSKLATPQTFNAARHLHEHLYKVWVVPSATSSPTQRGIQRF